MKLVLDTNVVLDWLVFRDAGVARLRTALEARLIELITHQPALDELRRVLAYPQFGLSTDQQQETLVLYRSLTRLVTLPESASLQNFGLPPGFPRCRDVDDRHFLALAFHERDTAVVSKDNAVLILGKRTQKFGVTILDPRQLGQRIDQLSTNRHFPAWAGIEPLPGDPPPRRA